jgi:hypothetical protein
MNSNIEIYYVNVSWLCSGRQPIEERDSKLMVLLL